MKLKLILIIAACAALAACANVVAGNSRTVTVKAGAVMQGKALELADAECGKYGRVARLSGKPMLNEYVYDCVSP